MSFTDWDFVRNKAAGNHACDFVLDDEVIRPFSGSMALLADYGSSGSRTSRCTSCVAVVVSALLSNMRADGETHFPPHTACTLLTHESPHVTAAAAALSRRLLPGTLKSLYSRGRSVYWDQACRPLTRGRVMAAPLDPVDLGGVVILYLCVTVLTMGLFAAGPYIRLWCDRNVFKVRVIADRMETAPECVFLTVVLSVLACRCRRMGRPRSCRSVEACACQGSGRGPGSTRWKKATTATATTTTTCRDSGQSGGKTIVATITTTGGKSSAPNRGFSLDVFYLSRAIACPKKCSTIKLSF